MPKQTTTLPLVLSEPAPGTPRHRWLYEQLRSAILDGRLRPYARLPATRDLAAQYGLSRGTILVAFDRLRSEGYVEARVGAGTYVRRLPPDAVATRQRPTGPKRAATPASPPRSEYVARLAAFVGNRPETTRAFRANQPALDAFPAELWARVASRRLRRGIRELLGNGEILGYRPLRDAVADYLNTMRGVRCAAEQVVIVSGAQEAIDLTARVLLNPGDPVWMEDPGYPGAVSVFRAAGARVLAAPVDDGGLDVLRAQRELGPAKLAYITPANQCPLGVTMTLERRLALLQWAEESGAVIIEDDYDGEYRYVGRPIGALQGLDRTGAVIYVGSFSKVLFPALRLGYLVVPDGMVEAFAAARSLTTRFPPGVEQAVLCDFMAEGHFGRHVRRMRELYAERLTALVHGVTEKLGGVLELARTDAGLQTVGWLPSGIDAETAASEAASRGVEVVPVGRCAIQRSLPAGLMLGFAAVDIPAIKRGVDVLALAFTSLTARARRADECGARACVPTSSNVAS